MVRFRLKKGVIQAALSFSVFFLFVSIGRRSNVTDNQQQKRHDVSTRVVTPKPGGPKSCSREIQPVHYSNDVEHFCESVYLGCMISLKGAVFAAKDQRDCVYQCGHRSKKYAGYFNTGECRCHHSMSNLGHLRTLVAGDDERTFCQRDDVIQAHFIKGPCVTVASQSKAEHNEPVTEPFQDSHIMTRSKGCFSYPTEESSFDCVRVTSRAQCLLLCERGRHPLAAYGSEGRCLCGRMSRRFNLTHKLDECGNFSEAVEVFRTTAEDERCGKVRFLPSAAYNRTTLNSTPCSGNTWIRYLLEKATGYYTGSVYNDGSLSTLGYLGEEISPGEQSVDMIKDHVFDDGLKLQASITIVRNPYRALISQRNWEKGNHHGYANEAWLKTAFPPAYTENNLRYWKWMITRTLESGKPYLIMFFEDIVADPISNVRKMVEFLPNPLLHPKNLEDRLACLSQDTAGMAKRTPRKLASNPWPAESIKIVNRVIQETRKILIDAGVKPFLPYYENDLDYSIPS